MGGVGGECVCVWWGGGACRHEGELADDLVFVCVVGGGGV